MKTIKLIPIVIAAGFIFSACEKDDNPPVNPIPAEVDSGRAAIGFGANPSFYGNSSFNEFNTTSTYAFSQTSLGVRQVQIKAVDSTVTDVRTVFLFLTMPETANTTSGNITINFANPPTEPYTAKLTLSHRVDTVLSRDYNSVSGNVIINKLNNIEVAGSFQGVVADTLGNTLTISGGTFSGKF